MPNGEAIELLAGSHGPLQLVTEVLVKSHIQPTFDPLHAMPGWAKRIHVSISSNSSQTCWKVSRSIGTKLK